MGEALPIQAQTKAVVPHQAAVASDGFQMFPNVHFPDLHRKDASEPGVSLSWLPHKGRNRHHFEYWIDYCRREDGTIYIGGCKMPKKYVAEMFCDRIAACRVYQGDQYTDASPYEYYQRSKDMRRTDASRFMHPDTAALLDRWLLLLKEQGEDAALASIRRELGDDAY